MFLFLLCLKNYCGIERAAHVCIKYMYFIIIQYFFLVTRLGSAWHVSSTHIVAPYRSFSREKIPGTIGGYIGLMHVNITLKGKF